MVDVSILDLIRIPEGGDARTALDNARDLAAAAEGWGYKRYWVSEHHNMPGIASAATPVVLAHIAGGTRTIRVGAGGVMLPNHPPLIVAEQFGTLARLFPDRVDLGLGRADGSVDAHTAYALRRKSDSDAFPEDVATLRGYFETAAADQAVQAVPAAGTHVPLWILGTSTFGAHLAATMGLPYAYGAHLHPGQLLPALDAYRRAFVPSAQLERPRTLMSLNVVAADTDEEARRLATTRLMSFTDLIRGRLGPSRPPVDDIDAYWSPSEKAQVLRMTSASVVGSAETVRAGLQRIVDETGVDEIATLNDIHDHAARLRSHEIIAQAAAGVTSRTAMAA